MSKKQFNFFPASKINLDYILYKSEQLKFEIHEYNALAWFQRNFSFPQQQKKGGKGNPKFTFHTDTDFPLW